MSSQQELVTQHLLSLNMAMSDCTVAYELQGQLPTWSRLQCRPFYCYFVANSNLCPFIPGSLPAVVRSALQQGGQGLVHSPFKGRRTVCKSILIDSRMQSSQDAGLQSIWCRQELIRPAADCEERLIALARTRYLQAACLLSTLEAI